MRGLKHKLNSLSWFASFLKRFAHGLIIRTILCKLLWKKWHICQSPDEVLTAVLAQTGFVAMSSPAWATLLHHVVRQALWVDDLHALVDPLVKYLDLPYMEDMNNTL